MPEGHIAERIAREHKRSFGGQRLRVDSPQGKFEHGAGLLDGARLVNVVAIGKHTLHRLRRDDDAPPSRDVWMHVHLGLYGKWWNGELPPPAIRGMIRVRLIGDEHWAELRGPTTCEVINGAGMKRLTERLGEDPLHSKQSGQAAYERISKSNRPIGELLMDQTMVSGVGNVYRAEVLFRHGISPHRMGRAISPDEWTALWADLEKLMRAGVRQGRIITTDPADRLRRSRIVSPTDQYYVYRRAGIPCRKCGTPVTVELAAGRHLYWCKACQPD